MKYILSKSNRNILQQYAWSQVMMAFDFDGTLAPIVSEPRKARMRPQTRHLLKTLAKLYPCVIISGRAQTDASRRLEGIAVKEVCGNHGIEPLRATKHMIAQVKSWRQLLGQQLKQFHGVFMEDKLYSIAIHYRGSRKKKLVRAAVLRAVSKLGKARLIPGKQVINILPPHAPHKGMALEAERLRLHCDTVIYVGDDETDEDVFILDQPGRLLTIRVGLNKKSAASYYLKRQNEINTFLKLLISLRQKAQSPAAGRP
jgi:trehalose 6-phosphate phosphatase